MKLLTAALSFPAMIVLAVSAHADPGTADEPAANNSGFLVALQKAGIAYNEPDHAITAAKAVCGLIDNGKPGLEILQGLMTTNPDFTMDGAAQFAAIAADSYCPHQLAPGGSAK